MMEFPIELRTAIEQRVVGLKQNQLKKIAQDLSERYRNESGKGKKLLTQADEAVVYSLVRMPATFGAVSDALQYALECCPAEIVSLLDVGAGTGAATWAVDALLNPEKITCLERESEMRNLGKELMQAGSSALQQADWREADLIRDPIDLQADLVVSSYVLNELSEVDRNAVLHKLWHSAKSMLLIVEPGTPAGYALLKKARTLLLAEGARIAAPCPHADECRMAQGDWCHFTTRIQRSKLHKSLKEGEAPFEDEKYAYMAFVKSEVQPVKSRILRHPYVEKGRITLELCSKVENKKIVVKKAAGDLFKSAKKAKCGDGIAIE